MARQTSSVASPQRPSWNGRRFWTTAPYQLCAVQVGVTIEYQRGCYAILELQEAPVVAFGRPLGRLAAAEVGGPGRGPDAAHHAPAQQAHDVHLVRPLIQDDAAAHS